MDGWSKKYDVEQIAREIKPDDWALFLRVIDETKAFAEAVAPRPRALTTATRPGRRKTSSDPCRFAPGTYSPLNEAATAENLREHRRRSPRRAPTSRIQASGSVDQ